MGADNRPPETGTNRLMFGAMLPVAERAEQIRHCCRPSRRFPGWTGVMEMDLATPVTQARKAVRRALDGGTAPFGLPAALLLEHGTLKLFFYEPRGEDRQPVHDQDEVYIVVSGFGSFAIGDSEETLQRQAIGPGDAIFAPAGAVHRFEDFTDDFETWVIMYGPDGGER